MREKGTGKSLLYKDIGQEQAFELGRYNRQLGKAETAQREDVESGALWDFLGSAALTTGMLLTPGVPKDPKSLLKYWQYGGEGGKWAQRLVSGYDPEDYAISTDPGKFDISQRYDFEDINRQFEEAQRSRFYKDLTGTGTTIATTLAFGAKGKPGVEGEADPSYWTKYIEGLFRKSEEDEVFVDALDQLINNPDVRVAVTE